MPVEYLTMMKSKDAAFRFGIRRTMVLEALEKGIKPTARAFKATVKTVRKWVKRYREKGLAGLKELSRAPKHIPHKTSATVAAGVVAKKKVLKGYGARRMVEEFVLGGFNEQEMGGMVGSFCPNILFPYAREVVSDLVAKGGFPQFILAPVNFDALYAQHLQSQAPSSEAIN